MASASRERYGRFGELLRGLARDVRGGGLLSQQPYHVDFCTCGEGDGRLHRCDDLRRPAATWS